MAYFYLHANGTVMRKPDIVVDAGGGPKEYFAGPMCEKVWFLDEKKMTSHEAEIFANAEYFTAVRGKRPNQTKEVFALLGDALKFAARHPGNKTMIYAVTEAGRDAHILNA